MIRVGPGLGPVRKDNLLSLMVYSATGNDVVTTMVGGDLVYNDGMMLNGTNLTERYLELAELVNSELY